jgi:hypothetical protein
MARIVESLEAQVTLAPATSSCPGSVIRTSSARLSVWGKTLGKVPTGSTVRTGCESDVKS